MGNLTRRAEFQIGYEGKDISYSLFPYLNSVSITENLKGTIDSISLQLNNRDNNFLKPGWPLEKGAKIDATIVTLNWENPSEGKSVLPCGVFYIDDRSFDEMTATIKGLSIPQGPSQDQKNSKTWSNITLEALGAEISSKYGLELLYLSDEKITFRNLKQDKETDFAFLLKIAAEEGLNLKITYNKLVLFDIETFEANPAARIISLTGGEISNWRIREKTKGVFDAVEIKYLDTNSMKEEEIFLTAEEIYGLEKREILRENRKILKLNKRSNSSDFKKLAKKKLKQENDAEVIVSFDIIGDRSLHTGLTFNLVNAGIFDGKYMILRVIKKMPGFSYSIEAYKVKGV